MSVALVALIKQERTPFIFRYDYLAAGYVGVLLTLASVIAALAINGGAPGTPTWISTAPRLRTHS